MIEKLEPLQGLDHSWLNKINELVDAVNKLDALLDLTNTAIQALKKANLPDGDDAIQECINDPYAEQRKWIGHLVEYGNVDDGFKYGILTNIEPTYEAYPFEIDNGRNATADCWLPHESVFYRKD